MTTEPASGPQTTIFLLEDDITVVQAVRDTVEPQGWGFRTRGLVEGCLEDLKRQPPSLILLDLSLPDGDGFSVLQGIRADKTFSLTPVFVLTSRADVASRVKGFSALPAPAVPSPSAYPQAAGQPPACSRHPDPARARHSGPDAGCRSRGRSAQDRRGGAGSFRRSQPAAAADGKRPWPSRGVPADEPIR